MRGKNILYTTSIIFGFSLSFVTNPLTTYANWYEKPFFKMNVGYGFPEKVKNHLMQCCTMLVWVIN